MRLRELHVTYRVRPDLPVLGDRQRLESPRMVAGLLRPVLESEPVEVLGVLCVTTKHRPLAWHELSRGTLDSALVHPREVFKIAFLANAAAVVIAHNHPSGDPDPSADDVSLTDHLSQAGKLLGVELIDHIIIGHDGRYYSFREGGRF